MINPQKNQIYVNDNIIPENIRKEILLENEKFNQEREKFLKLKDTLTLKIYCDLSIENPYIINIHKDKTLETVFVRTFY